MDAWGAPTAVRLQPAVNAVRLNVEFRPANFDPNIAGIAELAAEVEHHSVRGQWLE